MSRLEGLYPENVFYYFEQLSAVPRGSGDTKRISEYIVRQGEGLGLEVYRDDHDNVIIYKPASPGCENAPSVLLQSHIDMVCEKRPGTVHDFKEDGIDLIVKEALLSDDTIKDASKGFPKPAPESILCAKDTTLGADDGIGAAYMLALLSDREMPLPALECVFTSDEEIGMLGAMALDKSRLSSKLMINLDSEDEGYILTSCAGGLTATAHFSADKEDMEGTALRIDIGGLLGGHSGTEIDKGRANALILMGRLLYAIKKETKFNINFINGGGKDNAIPRRASVRLIMPSYVNMEPVLSVLTKYEKIFKNEYRLTDPGAGISYEIEESGSYRAMSDDATSNVISALINFPDGISKYSFDIPGLVQTSLNLGIVRSTDSEVTFTFSVRSSVESEKDELYVKLESLTHVLGGIMTRSGQYPPMEYREHSALRDIMKEAFTEQYGNEPVLYAIHAGVECGIFASAIEGLDAVSIGPDIRNVHTYEEYLDIASVGRTWDFLVSVLKKIGNDL